MTPSKIIARSRQSKRPEWDTPAFRKMCAARQAFIEALHEFLHTAPPREGQIEVDGTVSAVRQMAAVVDPRIVPGVSA